MLEISTGPQLILLLGYMGGAAALLVLYPLVNDGAGNTVAGKNAASHEETKNPYSGGKAPCQSFIKHFFLKLVVDLVDD